MTNEILTMIFQYCLFGGSISGIIMVTNKFENIYHLAFIAAVWPVFAPMALFFVIRSIKRFIFT